MIGTHLSRWAGARPWLFASALAGLALAAPAEAQLERRAPEAPVVSGWMDKLFEGEFLLGLAPGVNAKQLLGTLPLQTVYADPVSGTLRVQFGEQVAADEQALIVEALAALPGVGFVEPLRVAWSPEVHTCSGPAEVAAQQCTIAFADGSPSVEKFESQSVLDLTKFLPAQGWSKHYKDIVAVIDTGAVFDHPALAGRFVSHGHDFLLNDGVALDVPYGKDMNGNGLIDEAWGHGTHIASVIALLNPDALILPLRVLDSEGIGNSQDVACAIRWATDRGATAINLSLSMKQPSLAVAIALEYALSRDVQIVTSAGNTAKQKVLFPANYSADDFEFPPGTLDSNPTHFNNVVAVAAVDAQLAKADFSAWGTEVDLVAPGVAIYGAMPGGGYAWWSGTSMATAVVSGVHSLVRSVGGSHPKLDPEFAVTLTAQSVDRCNPLYSGLLGRGLPNAHVAAVVVSKKNSWWWGFDLTGACSTK